MTEDMYFCMKSISYQKFADQSLAYKHRGEHLLGI